jgi:Fic family protein
MADIVFKERPTAPAGLAWLIQHFGLKLPEPAVRSEIVAGARRTVILNGRVLEQYPKPYGPSGVLGNLRFALRYEPLDLGVWNALLQVLDRGELQAWVQADPTGRYARRAWYLYESVTGNQLDAADVPPTGYVDLADNRLQITGPVVKIRRQRVNLNLIGDTRYSVLVRRTEQIQRAIGEGLGEQARRLVESCDSSLLARAVHYLFTRETKSSFAIEGESPSSDRAERFVAALSHAAEFDTGSVDAFVRLQNTIVDRRYAESGWRAIQNYVGQTRSDYSEHVHFVSPKPEDVPELMSGWMRMTAQMQENAVDPVCAAAAVAFGFVFIHPFGDGNGRIHRFLVHHILARRGFTPHNLVFPVSAVMLRDRRAYDQVLARFSAPLMPFIDWTLDPDGRMTVTNQTAGLYRHWDATWVAEYLYGVIAETIRRDLAEEIRFLSAFDAAVTRTMNIVDMPDRRAALLVRLILQNQGSLSKGKRPEFAELSDAELASIEAAIAEVTAL